MGKSCNDPTPSLSCSAFVIDNINVFWLVSSQDLLSSLLPSPPAATAKAEMKVKTERGKFWNVEELKVEKWET